MSQPRIRFGPFEVALDTHEMWKNEVRVKLGGQPFEILAVLLARPGELVTREELRKAIWAEDTFVDFSHGLNAAMNKLREALCDSAEKPRYIETLPRRGYRFIGKIAGPKQATEPIHEPTSVADAEPSGNEWRGEVVGEEWESRVAVKRQTLVLLSTVMVFAVLAAAAMIIHWPGPSWHKLKLEAEKYETDRNIKLAAERSTGQSPAIWRLDVARAADIRGPEKVISVGSAIAGPQPSPDGKKLAFMSGSTERSEIWVSNLDGSSPHRLTSLGRCGTPRWSPDSRWIAFDSDGRSGRAGIYVVSADGGEAQALVADEWNNMVPSWSGDGRWIYFGSGRANDEAENEVWKVSFPDRQLVQLTRRGGFAAYESRDGQTIYYAKTRYDEPEIWEISVNGGKESRVSSLLRPSTWANWAVTEKGILFLSEYKETASTLEFFEFASGSVRPLAALEKASFWLSASSDGKTVWYSELTDEQARLVFRTKEF